MTNNTNWSALQHAYGPATDVPGLLEAAVIDPRPGHEAGSPWFALWSALCHQGDANSASLAAVPLLTGMAPAELADHRYDAVLLAASIEHARMEGRAPELPADLRDEYVAAIAAGLAAAQSALPDAWDDDSEFALRYSIAVFRGDPAGARAIFSNDLDDDA